MHAFSTEPPPATRRRVPHQVADLPDAAAGGRASGLAVTILRLAAAASVSSVAAGALLALFLLFGPLSDPQPAWAPGEPPPLDLLFGALRFGIEGAFILAALPALVAGSAMWALGRRHKEVHRPRAWAAAGACIGAVLFALAEALVGMDPFDLRTSTLEAALGASFLAAGAGAALAFRALMWLTAPFGP